MKLFFDREIRGVFIAVLFAAFLASFSFRIAAAQQPSGHEEVLLAAVNRERVGRGLHALKWDAALAEAARRHTALMARRNSLSHQLDGEPPLEVRASQAGAHFSQIAENIGEASEFEDLHYGWMHSPPHRANLLSPSLTSIGIAVQHSGKLFYATQDFSTAVAELSFREQEEKIGKLIEAKGLRVTVGSADARRQCKSPEFYPPPNWRSDVRFETGDLTRLPQGVERMISKHDYHAAAVGACPQTPAGGFSRYRFAVLLY